MNDADIKKIETDLAYLQIKLLPLSEPIINSAVNYSAILLNKTFRPRHLNESSESYIEYFIMQLAGLKGHKQIPTLFHRLNSMLNS